MDERMTMGWWRRNAVALAAVAVLVPATAAAISVNVWSEFDSGRPSRPIPVAQGSTAAYAGARVGDASARFDDEVEGVPRGARVVAVTVDVDPPPVDPDARFGFLCTLTLRESTGAHRAWKDASLSVDRPYDAERVTSCDPAVAEPYTLSMDFLVPEDAMGPFDVDFAVAGALPSVVRLAIEP